MSTRDRRTAVSVTSALERVVSILRATSFAYTHERDLQAGVRGVLRSRGLDPGAEVSLGPRDRIDFLVDRVGVEIKVSGSAGDVRRQLERYADSEAIDALVLVTSRVHHHDMPRRLNGKPVVVVSVVAGALS